MLRSDSAIYRKARDGERKKEKKKDKLSQEVGFGFIPPPLEPSGSFFPPLWVAPLWESQQLLHLQEFSPLFADITGKNESPELL